MNGTSAFSYVLIGDGPSDQALVPIIRWSIRRAAPKLEIVDPPNFIARRHRPIHEVLGGTVPLRPNLVFVHRDAEGVSYEERRREIPVRDGVVPIVPVRMTEAWLLLDEKAIRTASGNPNGRAKLDMPPVGRLERVNDPKRLLHELLLTASERTGRRRMRMEPGGRWLERLAELIPSYEPLMGLSAFREFWDALKAALPRNTATEADAQ